jgi:hypothetical protein
MRRSLFACSLMLGLTLASAEALAQDEAGGGHPVRYVDRPLTLPERTLRIDGHFPTMKLGYLPGNDVFFGFFAGAAYGIIDDLEVAATVIPLTFTPDKVRFQDPVLGATYRFFHNDVIEIGVGGRFQIPVDDGRYFLFNPRLPIVIHAGDIVRIDTGVNLSVGAPIGGGDAIVGLFGPGKWAPLPFMIDPGLPGKFSFQVIDQLYIAANTGFSVVSAFPGARGGDATVVVPIGWEVGGTIPKDDEPMVDIRGGFEFPYFLSSAIDDNPVSQIWVFHVGGSFYLPL